MSNVDENISDGWVETTLGAIMEISSGKTRPKIEGEIPIYGGNGIMGYGNKSNQEQPSIIVGRVGAYCGAVYLEKKPFWLSDNALGVRNNFDSDLMFLYYKLISMRLNNHAIGGAQPLVTQTLLKELEILIPKKIKEQKAIANILTAFDDKIENLQAQNNTLEQTAQTIFKEWFGKYQVGDELPDGWGYKTLDEVSILSAGGDKPKKVSEERTDFFNTPIYSNGINNKGLYGFTDKPKIEEESVTISARGTIGYVCLRFEPFVPIVRLVVAIPIQEFISSKYLYLYLKNMNILSTGTTQQQLTVPAFKQEKILIPKANVMKEFTSICDSLFSKIVVNESQIQTLKQTRDTLLPKLMSGQLRVNEFKS